MTPNGRGSGHWEGIGSGSVDHILEVLKDSQRRAVLTLLSRVDERTVTTDEVADLLAARVDDVPEKDLLKLRLHHIHLPKLAELGVIEYDPRSNMLRYIGDDDVETWLEQLHQWQD